PTVRTVGPASGLRARRSGRARTRSLGPRSDSVLGRSAGTPGCLGAVATSYAARSGHARPVRRIHSPRQPKLVWTSGTQAHAAVHRGDRTAGAPAVPAFHRGSDPDDRDRDSRAPWRFAG